ncbi:MAG: sigma-70 family RNA polymerase sigma factor [Lachnospiraceae bacterium]|nr:sigma-70 family RNA polymerase sigma factor [Lachnospiraceae bacterium]
MEEDFESFYKRTSQMVSQYLLARMADAHEVEDMVQETYAEALEQWDMLREHPNPCGWLLLTAKHICRRYYRRVYTRTEKLYEDSIAAEDPAYDMVVMEDLLHSLYRSRSEKLARAYFLGGATIPELAEDLHMSNKSISDKLYRIRRKLQDEWN